MPGELDQPDSAAVAWFKPRSRAGGNVQAPPVGCLAIELEGPVCLGEMIVGAHLDGTVAGVQYDDVDRVPSGVHHYRFRPEDVFSWDQLLPLADGIVDGDQLGAVRESGFDLHVVDHLRDAFHDVLAGEQRDAVTHQLRH